MEWNHICVFVVLRRFSCRMVAGQVLESDTHRWEGTSVSTQIALHTNTFPRSYRISDIIIIFNFNHHFFKKYK